MGVGWTCSSLSSYQWSFLRHLSSCMPLTPLLPLPPLRVPPGLHDLDPTFRSFSRSPAMEAVYRSLGFRRPLPVQSMFIFKVKPAL